MAIKKDTLDQLLEGRANRRNDCSKKTVLRETAKLDVRIPRDWEGTFDPKLIQRYQRRFPGFDDKIVSMYARGMSVREIQGHLVELYGIDVSPDLISPSPMRFWRPSPDGRTGRWRRAIHWSSSTRSGSRLVLGLDPRIRDEGLVRDKAVYIALGVAAEMETRTCLGYGSRTPRAQNSGSRR